LRMDPERPFDKPAGKARSDRAEALGFASKLIVGPIAFAGSATAVLWGAVTISFESPLIKLVGLAALVFGIFLAGFGWWFILGRPRSWFAPGENDPATGPPHQKSTMRDWVRRRG